MFERKCEFEKTRHVTEKFVMEKFQELVLVLQ